MESSLVASLLLQLAANANPLNSEIGETSAYFNAIQISIGQLSPQSGAFICAARIPYDNAAFLQSGGDVLSYVLSFSSFENDMSRFPTVTARNSPYAGKSALAVPAVPPGLNRLEQWIVYVAGFLNGRLQGNAPDLFTNWMPIGTGEPPSGVSYQREIVMGYDPSNNPYPGVTLSLSLPFSYSDWVRGENLPSCMYSIAF
ncbi:MAG: hypothetical protein NVS2B14_00350 [Chamaesiphon sp.]